MRAVALVALLIGCSTGRMSSWEGTRGRSGVSTGQSLWERCTSSIRAAQCSDGDDVMYATICMRRIGDEYRAQRSLASGREVLIENGCSPSIVGVGGSGSFRGSPPTTGYQGTASLPPGSRARVEAERVREQERAEQDRVRAEVLAADGGAWTGYRAVTDEFTGEVEHRVRARFSDEPIDRVLVRTAIGAETASIEFRLLNPRPRYATCRMVNGLADTTRLTISEAEAATREEVIGAVETLTVHVPRADLGSMAAAQVVRFRVCGFVIQMRPDFPSMIATLLRATMPEAAEATEP